MNRRQWLKASAGLATLAAVPSAFAGEGALEYTPEIYKAALDSGEPVLVDFYTDWCSTCRTQARVVEQLMNSNEAYGKVKLIQVNWDKYSDSDLAKELEIPRRSTLVMFKGGVEVGRVIAQTSAPAIEELFKAVV